MAAATERSINLLPAEQLLRELLLECAQHFSGLQIWIAGGWVRDRLLGIPSSDLDLALSNVTGRSFGIFLEGFCANPEIEDKYRQKAAELGVPDASFTRFHIIKRNANKSKNLETAGGKLFGLDIDLVNLRKEVYDGHSRTPEMEFGKPEEDALRRDATVNSLLYDLKKKEVLDLTGNGLKDLEARIMRTPLDPRQTFMDDPLRVLRLIRIGSKLGFAIDPKAINSMKDEDIRRALDTMVTRDRIGTELFKMMRGPNTEVAFRYLFEANLYAPVFIRLNSSLLRTLKADYPAAGPNTTEQWPTAWPRAYQLLDYLLNVRSCLGDMVRFESEVDYLWSMVAYAPFSMLRHTLLRPAVEEATAAIRAPAKVSKLLANALRNFDSIQVIVKTIMDQPDEPPTRSLVGMAIRSWGTAWTTQVTYAILALAVDCPLTSSSESLTNKAATDELVEESVIRRYSTFADFVWQKGLQDAHLQRPLLDGKEIQDLFGLQKGGKFIKTALDSLLVWQFDHMESSIEEAKKWLLNRREELGIPQCGKP